MAAREGQLDEISQAIGRLSGQVDSLDRYTHEREHSINNLVQKVEALGTRITRDIAAVEGRIEGRIKAMDDRIVALELAKQREAGAKNLVVWLLQSPLIGWIAAGIMFFAALWKKP
jgi:septal ring factor EnvC (AmiA/AmiB activator)